MKTLFSRIFETRFTAAPVTFKTVFFQKILGFNRKVYWPTHFTSQVKNYKNIVIGVGTAPGLSPGCYIQGGGKIEIGDYTIIAPNVGIISSNHDLLDNRKYLKSKVYIGKYCWIGMNSTVLPGTELGDFTIVGAGSVVTKSFKDGYCIIGGTPAKIIKKLNKKDCVYYKNDFKYNGYIKADEFQNFKKKYLNE